MKREGTLHHMCTANSIPPPGAVLKMFGRLAPSNQLQIFPGLTASRVRVLM